MALTYAAVRRSKPRSYLLAVLMICCIGEETGSDSNTFVSWNQILQTFISEHATHWFIIHVFIRVRGRFILITLTLRLMLSRVINDPSAVPGDVLTSLSPLGGRKRVAANAVTFRFLQKEAREEYLSFQRFHLLWQLKWQKLQLLFNFCVTVETNEQNQVRVTPFGEVWSLRALTIINKNTRTSAFILTYSS